MEDNTKTKQSFDQAIDTLKEADKRANNYVRDTYRTMIRYYLQVGEGGISKYAGAIITDKLVKVLAERYVELGGSYSDLYIK